MTLCLLFITLRLSLRFTHRAQPSNEHVHRLASLLSDIFLVFSWLSGLVLISINTWKNLLRYKYLNYQPKSDLYYMVPREQAGHLLYVSWISLFFIYISLWFSKAAFLAFYYSLFQLQGRKTRIVLYGACIFTAATFVLHMLLLTLWCHPISSNWTTTGELCSAVHSISSVTISTFANVATDLIILAIPIVALTQTRLSKAQKSGVVFIFLVGSISIIAALARFVTLELVQNVPKASITHTIDVWALVEIVASELAVCLPGLRTFLRRRKERQEMQEKRRSGQVSNSDTSSLQPVLERSDSESGNNIHVTVEVKQTSSTGVMEV